MNRETKIGMLTGLGVIVLLGVLLSAYFEKDTTTNQAAMMQDVGEHYRAVAQAPLGVASATPTANVNDPVMMIGAPGQPTPPPAFAAGSAMQGPTVQAPVTAVPGGTITATAATDQAAALRDRPVATDQARVSQAIYVPAGASTSAPAALRAPIIPAASAAVAGMSYTIAKGDTLIGISRKQYHSATKADMARIIAANPGLLKDEKTPLVAGKKLVLPAVAATSGAKTTAAAKETRRAKADPAIPASKGALGKTYTVVQGDNLAKIAAKTMGSKSKQAQQKIATLNGLKNLDAVRVGQVLKIPV